MGRLRVEARQRLLAVVDRDDLVPFSLEVVPQAVCEVLFVLDDENAAHGAVRRGNWTMNVLPWPGPPLSA
jgi:hypothetical protein